MAYSQEKVEKVLKCAADLSRDIFKRWGIYAFPMIGDLESTEGASSLWLTFRRGGVEGTAGSPVNEGKTGSELLNGLAH